MAKRPTASAFALSHGLAFGELRIASATCVAVTSAAAIATAETAFTSQAGNNCLKILIDAPVIGYAEFDRRQPHVCRTE